MTVEATYRVPVDGMTFTTCVGRITRALRTLGGVESVRVDLSSDSATVSFDPDRTSLAVIAAAVEAAGYRAQFDEAVLARDREPRTVLSVLRRLLRA